MVNFEASKLGVRLRLGPYPCPYPCSGGSRGGARDARPPCGPKFLQFHAVFSKNWPNNRLAPPLGLAPPPLGNPASATAMSKLLWCSNLTINKIKLLLFRVSFQFGQTFTYQTPQTKDFTINSI